MNSHPSMFHAPQITKIMIPISKEDTNMETREEKKPTSF